VRFIWSSNIIVHDITLKDSPAWMLYLSWVTTAHIYNVNLTTPPLPIAHNTDGMDIDCSVDVLIENCHYQGSEYVTYSIDQKPST
jgi:polygalacturonase